MTKEYEPRMRNKNELNGNIVKAGKINRDRMLELVESTFSRHRSTLECPLCELVTTLWKYENTARPEYQNCSQCMIQTTGRYAIKLMSKQLRE